MTDCNRVECMGNNGCIDKCWKPQRTWVGLTDEEIAQMGLSNYIKVVRATEAKLKDKNI